MKQRGFTMIEFLVVAVLIGILSTLGFGAYSRSLSRGRDAKRVSYIQSVQKMFEMYYSLNGSYDPDCTVMFGGTTPTPPKGSLVYLPGCRADGYIYCTQLENGADYGNYRCDPTTDTSNCHPVTDKQTHFCVTNVQ